MFIQFFTFALMTTGAFSRSIIKLFSELKLLLDNLLFIPYTLSGMKKNMTVWKATVVRVYAQCFSLSQPDRTFSARYSSYWNIYGWRLRMKGNYSMSAIQGWRSRSSRFGNHQTIYSHFVYSHFVYCIFCTVSSTPILFTPILSTPILSTPISSTFAFQYMNDGRLHTTY